MNISKITIILVSLFLSSSLCVWAQENPAEKNKSEVHIKTIKIENGDTLIEEKVFIDDIPSVMDSSYKHGRILVISNGRLNDSIMIFKNLEDGFAEEMNDFGDQFNMLFADPVMGGIKFLNEDIAMCLDTAFRNFELRINDSIFPWNDMHLYMNSPDYFLDDDAYKPNPKTENYENDPVIIEKKIIIIDDDPYSKSGSSGSDAGIQGVSIYPNPSEGEFNLSFMLNKNKKTIVEIVDSGGRIIQKETVNKGNGLFNRQFDMTAYGKGNYYVKLTQGKASISQMIIVK